jgi:hypothetical protein
MTAELLPIPKVPNGLREAALRGNLILFIGAGASRLAGCPGWDDFANGALQQLMNKGTFNFSQFDQVKHLNPRIKLSIAATIATENRTLIDYKALLHPKPKGEHDKGRRLYKSLFALSNIFVTTNYDEWLDDAIQEPSVTATPGIPAPETPAAKQMRVIYDENEFLAAALIQPYTVVHLHGSVVDSSSMIFTTHDYIKRYANDRLAGDASKENRVLTFLQYLFDNKTVLFVGYGLEELEILEYVILKARRPVGTPAREARHYLLEGFFSHQDSLRRSLETYFLGECGIQLVPFLRDNKDRDQLLDVLEDFAQRMPASAPLVLQKAQDMERLAREMETLTND